MPGNPERPGFDVKVHITAEHLGAYDAILNAKNKSKLVMQLAVLGFYVVEGKGNGAPILTEESKDVPVISFDDDGQGFG